MQCWQNESCFLNGLKQREAVRGLGGEDGVMPITVFIQALEIIVVLSLRSIISSPFLEVQLTEQVELSTCFYLTGPEPL